MVQEGLMYHSTLINILLVTLMINLWIPWVFSRDIAKQIKATRISFFFFSAVISMVGFSGMVLFLVSQKPWSMMMTLMVIVLVLLCALEVARSKKLTKLWRDNHSVTRLSWRYVAAQIVITVGVIVVLLAGSKDAVPLP